MLHLVPTVPDEEEIPAPPDRKGCALVETRVGRFPPDTAAKIERYFFIESVLQHPGSTHASFLTRLRSQQKSILRDPEIAHYIRAEEILNSAASTLPQIFPPLQLLDGAGASRRSSSSRITDEVRRTIVREMSSLFGILRGFLHR